MGTSVGGVGTSGGGGTFADSGRYVLYQNGIGNYYYVHVIYTEFIHMLISYAYNFIF